jgi:hypothetical protein
MNRIIETMGYITKVEKLETLNNNILENTLVLEETEPFPGYHGANLPTGYNPTAVYLILRKKTSTVKIMRHTQHIHKYFKPAFDGTAAQVSMNNDLLHCIRLRYLVDYASVPDIQKCYMHEGLAFMKKKKMHGDGVIEIKKHFELQDMEEGIYKDLEDPLMYYLQIPAHLNWSVFLEITTSIKHNLDNLSFDAALGAIYLKEITEVVRIFAGDMGLEDLKKIRERYVEELRKY